MAQEFLDPIPSGGVPSIRRLERMARGVRETTGAFPSIPFAGYGDSSDLGLIAAPVEFGRIVAKITTTSAADAAAYGWVQVVPQPGGTWGVYQKGLSGDNGSATGELRNPAYEANGVRTVQPDAIVELVRAYQHGGTAFASPGQEWVFDASVAVGAGTADENSFRSGAGICPVVTNHELVRTVPQFPDAAEYTATPLIPQAAIDDANAYLNRYYGRTGYWPSGMMDRGGKGDTGLVGLDRDHLYGSPFIAPRGMTISDLVAMVNSIGTMRVGNSTEAMEEEPITLGAFAPKGQIKLGIYETLSTTDLRPGTLLAQTQLLPFDLMPLTEYANQPQGRGTLPVGGELYAADADLYLDDPTPATLTAGRLYWFCVAWYPERFYGREEGDAAVEYPLLHLPGSGPRQEVVPLDTRLIPVIINEKPDNWATGDEPVFGHVLSRGVWHEGGWDDDLEDTTTLVGMPVPTGNGLRAKLPTGGTGQPHWETREDGPVFPASWPLASTRLDVPTYWTAENEPAAKVRARTFGCPIIHAVDAHQPCTSPAVCLTAEELCLTLPYTYDANGTPYSGTEQVILQRVQAPWPAVFTGTAIFAPGEPDELVVDLALTVDEPDGTELPTASLTAAVFSYGGTVVSDTEVTLSAWYGSLEVTACNPFAMTFTPRGVPSNTDPLTLTWDTDYVVEIDGGTATSDLGACGVAGLDCPDTDTLCVRLPYSGAPSAANGTGVAYGTVRYTGGTWDGVSPREYVGAVKIILAGAAGGLQESLTIGLRVTITGATGAPPTDVSAEVVSVSYLDNLPPINSSASATGTDITVSPPMSNLAVAACDPFTAYFRPTGGAWGGYGLTWDNGSGFVGVMTLGYVEDPVHPGEFFYGGLAETLVDCHAAGGIGHSGTETEESEDLDLPGP